MINAVGIKAILGSIPSAIIALRPNSPLLPYYHVVNDEDPQHIKHLYACRKVADFTRDLDFLLRHYVPISLEDVYNWLRHNKNLRQKSFHLTFDDGFRECYDIIAPILKKKGIPATFFLCSDFIENKRLFFRNKVSLLLDEFGNKIGESKEKGLAEVLLQHGIVYQGFRQSLMAVSYENSSILDMIAGVLEYDFDDYLRNYKPYLSLIQVEDLAKDGFAIGSHSVDHPLYGDISLEKQIQQTKEGMAAIEGLCPVKIKAFAFPHHGNSVTLSFFRATRDMVDIYFGTNRMKKDIVPECLQRFSLEDNRYSCEEIIKKNILLQAYYQATFRGTVRRKP